MANDINVVTLVGRLTRECQLKYTNSGTAVCKFSLAVNRKKKQGDQWVDEVSYFDIVLWGKQGEAISQYLLKGKQIAVSGELRQNRWEQDGQNRSKVEINASNVQLLSSDKNTQQTSQQSQGGQSQQGQSNNNQGGSGHDDNFSDDVPW